MATVNDEQVSRVAAFLKANPPKGGGMNFHSVHTPKGELVLDTMFPPIGHEHALDFFFFACLYQYGFWYGSERGYLEPMVGNIAEKRLKGSDLLWTLFKRELDGNPDFFRPEHLANLSPGELTRVLTDDEGTQWPDFDERLKLARRYGRWLLEHGATPRSIVADANETGEPLHRFLLIMETGPFGDDDLMKKQLLLAMALANRPERFLVVTDPGKWFPIVDYHLMRVALRLGLVELDTDEANRNEARRWVSPEEEAGIRKAAWSAVRGLIQESGLPMAAVDETLWMARKYCPEMEQPNCGKCLFNEVCAKRTELFQPVLRTTAY